MNILDNIATLEKDGVVYYRLKDLHNISGAGKSKEPYAFLRYVSDFIQTANSRFGKNQVVTELYDGSRTTFGTELVCIRYAAYINPDFELDVYLEFMERHTLAESISKYTQLKADALEAMCNKGSTMTVTEAACQISKIVGYNISCRWLNDFLCEDHYKFKHWYDQKSGGGRKSNWIQEVKIRKYVAESYSIDKFGNRHKQLRITSRGAQYLAEWLNRYHAVFPRKP